MRKLLIPLLIFVSVLRAAAQFSMPVKLDPRPEFGKMLAEVKEPGDELVLLNEITVEYAYDKKGELMEYYYVHNVRYVSSADAIDRNNKIYVSLKGATTLEGFDARVVLANGTIKSMGDEALKQGTTEDGTKVTYFAISGAEKGSFIEYYYLIHREPDISGSYITFQGKNRVLKTSFRIHSPSNLVFTTRSYNGFVEMKDPDSSLEADENRMNKLIGTTYNIPGIEDEAFANLGGNKMKVVYQLYYNTSKRKKNPYNYGVISQSIFDIIVNDVSKDDLKAVEKVLKASEIKFAPDEESKARAIENEVKSKFGIANSGDVKYTQIASICKEHLMNERGATKLLYHLLTSSGIDVEIVICSNRFNVRFDPEFESYAFLDNYLLYLPSLKMYIAPVHYAYRLGLTPYEHIENNALFIRKVSVGDIATGAGKIKPIAAGPASATNHNTKVMSYIDPALDSLHADLELSYTGYYAHSFQPYFDNMPKAKLTEYEEEIVKTWQKDISIHSVKTENAASQYLPLKPLVVKAHVASQQMVERAGPKILVHIGELIGPQAELYQKSTRVLPIENDYNREYHRDLYFKIPEGYTVKNLNDLNMKTQPFLGSGDGAGFVSTYTLEGDTVHVKCDEYYSQISMPLSAYEDFRKVVNAAANFNKIVLVLEKK